MIIIIICRVVMANMHEYKLVLARQQSYITNSFTCEDILTQSLMRTYQTNGLNYVYFTYKWKLCRKSCLESIYLNT